MERIENPLADSTIMVAAEQTAVLSFSVENSNDFPAAYSLDIAGLPLGSEAWAAPDPTGGSVSVRPQGMGSLLARVTPPATLVGRTIPIQIRVLWDGQLDHEIPLSLEIAPVPAQTAPAMQSGNGAQVQTQGQVSNAVQSQVQVQSLDVSVTQEARIEQAGQEEKARLEQTAREEQDRLEQARIEQARLEQTVLEQVRLEAQRKADQDRLDEERRAAEEASQAAEVARQQEQERLKQAELEQARIAQDQEAVRKAEQNRLEQERFQAEQARLEQARLEVEAKQKAEEQARLERERLEREREDRQKREREDREKREAEQKAALIAQAEAQRKADEERRARQEQQEREEAARREAENVRKAEEARLAAEQAEAKRKADEQAQLEQQRQEKARLEAERKAAEAKRAEEQRKADPRVVDDFTYRPTGGANTAGTNANGGNSLDSASIDPNAPLQFREQVVRNPQETTVYSLRPGTSLVVAVTVKNEDTARRALRYSLTWDEPTRNDAAKRAMIELIRPELNLIHGAEGELYARVSVPKGADPATVSIGFLVGPDGYLKPVGLRVRIEPIPAVTLSAAKAEVKTSPFPKFYVDFELTVGQLGNSDTAFRITVVNPEVRIKTPTGYPTGDNAAVYESGVWRYSLDRELDNLKSAGFGNKPAPVPVRLRVERRGAWWWGRKESQTVTVRAVPVTDTLNGGQAGNEVTLTAVRARPTPFPPILLLVLLLLLWPIFGGRPTDLSVANADAQAGAHEYWVVKEGDKLSATVKWTNPFLMAANLTADGGNAQKAGLSQGVVTANVSEREPYKVVTVGAKSPLGLGETIRIHFLRARPDTPLFVLSPTLKPDPESKIDTLRVPKSGVARLFLWNDSEDSSQITVRIVAMPETYSISDLGEGSLKRMDLPVGYNSPLEYMRKAVFIQVGKGADGKGIYEQHLERYPSTQMHVKISRKSDVTAQEEMLILATTDAGNPNEAGHSDHRVIKIRLVPDDERGK